VLELHAELDISHTFNIVDLYKFQEGIAEEDDDYVDDWKEQIPEPEKEKIAEMLELHA